MSNDKYYDRVLAYLTEHGETGVNELAKAVQVPLSNMQRYLTGQTYFRKTVSRKWDLPINVDADIQSNTMALMVDSVEIALKLLDSQISEIQSSVRNALLPVNTLQRAVVNINTTVADKPAKLDDNVEKLLRFINAWNEATKKHKTDIDENYRDLIINLDIARLVTERGLNFFFDPQYADITAVLMSGGSELSNETIKVLEEYQKEA